jgi:predicted Holliday junction resolvase-like endonuclease
MASEFFILLVMLIVMLIAIAVVVGIVIIIILQQSMISEDKWRNEVMKARVESVAQSRATLKGRMFEQIAPLLPGFDYLPADCHFLGCPIDYVVFDGYTIVKDKQAEAEPIEIVLLDIKSGNSRLSKEQRAIALAIEEGRVRFEIVHILTDGTVDKHAWRRRSRKASSQQLILRDIGEIQVVSKSTDDDDDIDITDDDDDIRHIADILNSNIEFNRRISK